MKLDTLHDPIPGGNNSSTDRSNVSVNWLRVFLAKTHLLRRTPSGHGGIWMQRRSASITQPVVLPEP